MNPQIIIITIPRDHCPCATSAESILEWVLGVPIEGEAGVAVQCVDTAMMFLVAWHPNDGLRWAKILWHIKPVAPGIPFRTVTLAACFPSRMPRSWSSSRNCYTREPSMKCFLQNEISYLL